jgi:hypothetical protein
MASPTNFELSPESLEKAKKELNEVPEERKACIDRLRKDALSSQEGKSENEVIPLERIDDDSFLLRFLRSKKFRHEDSLKKYLTYCEFRVTSPEIFNDLSFDTVRYIYECEAFCVLEPRLRNGCKMIVFFPDRLDLNTVNFYHIMGAGFLLMDKLLEDPNNQVNGLMVVRDWTGVGFTDTLRLQLFMRKEMSKFVSLFQDAMPARFKAFWNFRAPWYISMLFKIISPFMSEKVNSRVLFLGDDLSPLYELIDPEELPENLGGLKPPMDASHTLSVLGVNRGTEI